MFQQPPTSHTRQRTRHARRLLAIAFFCVAIAAFLQLPIAWAFALASRTATPSESVVIIHAPHGFDTDTPIIRVERTTTRGACTLLVEAFPPGVDPSDGMPLRDASVGSQLVFTTTSPWQPEELHPALADAADWPRRTGVYARPNLVHTETLAHRFASGWPWLCVEGRIDWNPSTRQATTSGIITDAPLATPPNALGGFFCYYPRWPALIANTLTHAAILATLCLLASFTFRSIRARSRRRRNLCPTCAYDLQHTSQGQLCPECGTRHR